MQDYFGATAFSELYAELYDEVFASVINITPAKPLQIISLMHAVRVHPNNIEKMIEHLGQT